MSTRNPLYQALTVTVLVTLLLSQSSAAILAGPTSPEVSDSGELFDDLTAKSVKSSKATLLYDHFVTDGYLNPDLWYFQTNGNGSWSISDSILAISGGTVNGAGGWVHSQQQFTPGAETLSLETRIAVSAADGGYWGFYENDGGGTSSAAFSVDPSNGDLRAQVYVDSGDVSRVAIPGIDVTAWHTYRIEIAGSTANFYVDDVLKVTHTENVPQGKAMHIRLDRSSWGQNQTLSMDYVELWRGELASFFDDFNDGNADGWNPVTGTWAVLTDVPSIPYAQASDPGGSHNVFVTFYTESQFTDFEIEVDITSTSSIAPGSFNVGVALRGDGSSNYYRVIFHPNYSGGALKVQKVVDGTEINIVPLTDFDTPPTSNTLKVVAQGNTFSAFVNDVFVTSWTDNTFPTGFIGLTTENGSANFDNVRVTTSSAPDTTKPATITLSATHGTYPGDIILSWIAPGDDGNTGTASFYEVRQESVLPIETEEHWEVATVMEGAPIPLVAGTAQSMTVSLIPGGTSYFAIKARDDAGNWSDLSNSPSAKTPGRLVSNINAELRYNPSAILNEEVTVLVIPVRTDDWTLGVGDYSAVVEIVQFLRHFREALLVKGGLGSFVIAVKAVLGHVILDSWFQMRAQLVWGLHESEYSGDPTLLVWDPSAPLMNHGVPYVVTGIVRKKTFFDVLALREDYFYYLKVENSSEQVVQQPSTTHPHFTIPAGYTYHNWEDIHLDGITGYGDQICAIGMVTERYPLDGYHYVRIQLMERLSGALVVRVPINEEAPDMAAMALFCGTKQAAGGDALHPGWLPIAKHLDTTTGQGDVQLLQGTSSTIVRHERRPITLFGIEIGSPADIHVYDPEGNHIGVVYDGSGDVIGMENEIPDAEYFYGAGDTPEFVSIGNPTAGTYTVTVRGTDTGTYTQTLRIYDSSGEQTYTSTLTSQPTSAGQEDTMVVDEIPAAPTGLEVDVDNSTVNLDWDDNTESDLAGYNVYRSTQANGVYQKINDSPLSVSSFTDSSADEYTAYYYYVTAEDTDHNESGHLTPVVSRYLIYLPLVLRNH